MKGKHRFSILVLIAVSFILAACSNEGIGTQGDDIAEAYAALNGTESSGGNVHLDVNLPSDHVFKTEPEDDILTLLRDGTGVVYFGFPTCPWCRNAMPVMNEAAHAVGLSSIYYVDIYDHRDTKELDENGEIVTVSEGTQFYRDLLEILGDNAPEYSGLDDPTIRRVLVPLVVVVVDGEIKSAHLSTVESQEDPYVALTDAQHAELLDIYKGMFSEIPGCGEDANVC